MYAAARPSKIRTRPPERGGSPDSHFSGWSMDVVRRRCRELARDNVFARSVIHRTVDLVCAGGHLGADPMTDDKGWNNAAYAEFLEYDREHEFQVSRRQALHGMLVDGDVLGVRTDAGVVQVVPSELIKNPGDAVNTPDRVSGVELDPVTRRPLRFYVARYEHDGSVVGRATTPVPADACCWLARQRLPGQVRGEPLLAGAVELMEVLGHYILDTAIAAEVATRYLGAVADQDSWRLRGTSAAPAQPGGEQALGSGGVLNEQLTRQVGVNMLSLSPGGTLQFAKPEHPTTNFADFVRMVARAVGADAGLPVELALLDFSQTNLASARAAQASAMPGLLALHDLVDRRWSTPIYRWVIARAIAEGRLPFRPDWARVRFRPSPPPVFHELEYTQAKVYQLNNNMITLDDLLTEWRGDDWERVAHQRGDEMELQRELNVMPVQQPGARVLETAPGRRAGVSEADGPDADPDAKPEPEGGGGADAGGNAP